MPRIPFSEWPKIQVGDLRVLIANTDELARQGLTDATEEKFGNSIICFTYFEKGNNALPFSIRNIRVPFDIDIAYIDKNAKVIEIGLLTARNPDSRVPSDAELVIEAKKGWLDANGFTEGSIFGL